MEPKLKILCVEDEPALLEILTSAAEAAGFEPLGASNGSQAIELLKANADRIALVVSDIMMPDMNGFQLRKAMLPDFKGIPFVVASGRVTREEALEALEGKVSSFVPKPYSQKQLEEAIVRESADRAAAIRDEDEMRAGFVVEASGMIEEMEGLLLSLESDPSDTGAINRVFACAHTIKGTSGFFKPDTIHRFTHRYEDYLSVFKKNPSKMDSRGIEVLLQGLDTIRKLVSLLASGSKDSPPLEELLAVFDSKTSEAEGSVPVESAAALPPEAAKKSTASKADEIRVSLPLLDRFMERSGELTVLRNMVNKSLRVIEQELPSNSSIATLSELLSEMHKVNAFIQDQVVDMRKVALRQVFKPILRTLRDLSASLKKKIVLQTEGEDLRVDHILADALSKCLIHMIRNAADHGIESPVERERAGKPATGTIRMIAAEVSEEIVIRIRDDGKGIDPQRIRTKAIEKGLITPSQAQTLSDSEIRLLIFEPGFSTAETITDVSGRGVGTDMVKSTMQALGGKIELLSELGKGTEFVLRLPIPKSVLIIASLIVKSKNRTFALPQDRIVRVIRPKQQDGQAEVVMLGSAPFLKEPSRITPIVDLAELVGDAGTTLLTDCVFVHVASSHGDYCLSVQEVLEIEDTVVRKPGPWFKHLPVYAGVTFLGDGGIGLILDVDGIAARYRLVTPPKSAQISFDSDAKKEGELSVLLFDLGTPTRYGARWSDIFRLEVFQGSEVQYSGLQPVIHYRYKTMPLYGLRDCIEPGCGNQEAIQAASLSVVVIQDHNNFKGFVVNGIRDFVLCQESDSPNLCLTQDATVTLVPLHDLAKKLAS